MPERPEEFRWSDRSEAERSAFHDTARGPRATRTMAAWRGFLKALRADLGTVARGLVWRVSAGGRRPPPIEPAIGQVFLGGRFRRRAIGILQLCAALWAIGAVAVTGGMVWALEGLPALARPIGETSRPSLIIEAADGESLGRVGPLKSPEVSRENFADPLVRAVLSAEDRRFYDHWGVDPFGIFRALRRNLAAGTVVEGGSTISQQLVKIRLLQSARTPIDKLRKRWLPYGWKRASAKTRFSRAISTASTSGTADTACLRRRGFTSTNARPN